MHFLHKRARMGKSMGVSLWICSFLLMVEAQTHVEVKLLKSAVKKGAVCLDGSAPGYSYVKGYGSGSNSWMVVLQGGAWCYSIDDCRQRTKTHRGSSHRFPQNTTFTGIYDLNSSFNPHFYNWHIVYIYYCDGASFMADAKHPVHNLYFRGARIVKVMLEEMLSRGMKNARNALLTGSSAGAMGVAWNCDRFGALFSHTTRVKCISDSGYFIYGKDLPGYHNRANFSAQIIATHELTKLLPTSCTEKVQPELCIREEFYVGEIKTPIFFIESGFDLNVLRWSLAPMLGGKPVWAHCLNNFTSCTSSQIKIMRDYRASLVKSLLQVDHSSSRGLLVHSCVRHGHLHLRSGWSCFSINANNKTQTIEQVVSDWYFDRSSFQWIDVLNDLPFSCPTYDTDENDKKCLATLAALRSQESMASNHIQGLLYLLMQILIALSFV